MGSKIQDTINMFDKRLDDAAKNLHNKVNHYLLENNYEEVARYIALESALLASHEDNRPRTNPLLDVLETDILTYSEKINKSSSGISTYVDSAKEEIAQLLNLQTDLC